MKSWRIHTVLAAGLAVYLATQTPTLAPLTTHRHLEGVADDDDETNDHVCREYLVNFLNGTTDNKDECEGIHQAIKAANCKAHSNKKHRLAVLDADALIDDAIELYECCITISDIYEKRCEEAGLDATRLFGIMSVLVLCGFVKSLLRVTNQQWIPDAGGFIMVGAICGFLLRILDPEFVGTKLSFDNDLFLQILLPPIIFEASLSIDKTAFRRDLFPILTMAVFGTFFSALAIGYGTYHLSNWGTTSNERLPLLDSMIFGALMSSIDPVATLSILSGVGVRHSDTLYTLIFGESLLNDGVSIVLFNSLVHHMGDTGLPSLSSTIGDFFVVVIGSILVGLGCGAVCTVYFWSLRDRHTAVTEVAMFFTWALIPYYIADGMKLSGIIAIMVMGFMLDYFVIGASGPEEEAPAYSNVPSPFQPRMSRFQSMTSQAFSGTGHIQSESRQHVGFVASVITNLMETAIFSYLGLFLFNDKTFEFNLIWSSLFSCIASRAAMVLGAGILINFCVLVDLENTLSNVIANRFGGYYTRPPQQLDAVLGGTEKVYLDQKKLLILFSAGIRGAVSYALVQNIPVYNSVTKHGSKFKGELRTMTSFTIVFLLFSFGALTFFTMNRDRIEPGSSNLGRSLLTTTNDSLLLQEEDNTTQIPLQPVNRQPLQ